MALHESPKVVAVRDDTRQSVKLRVVSLSATAIEAVVKRIPSRKSDPAAGKTWTLVVRAPKDAGGPAQAVEPLETVAANLLDGIPDLATSRGKLELPIANPGDGKLAVLVGGKHAKVLSVEPNGGDPAEELVTVRVPKLPTGSYPLTLANALGPGANSLDLWVLQPRTGTGTSATISGKPPFETSATSYSYGGTPAVLAWCDDGPGCDRGLRIYLSASELQNAGTYDGADVVVTYHEGDLVWSSESASVTITAPGVPLHSKFLRSVKGLFSADLVPVSGGATGDLAIRGDFSGELDSY